METSFGGEGMPSGSKRRLGVFNIKINNAIHLPMYT